MGRDDEERKSVKRKRNHEEDLTNNVKAKKRKHSDNEGSFHLPEDVYNEERDDPSDLDRSLALKSREPGDDYVLYLVRKPARLTLDQLAAVPLPKKAKKVKTIELQTDDGTFKVQTGALCDRFMHVSSETACGLSSKAVCPDGVISGLVTITATTPEDLPLGQIYEESDEIPENAEPPAMKTVRKKPKTKPRHYDGLSERLVAYGIEPKNCERLPGLIQNEESKVVL